MKAKINGIELEGTPQEIMEFQRLQEENKTKQFAPTYDPYKYQKTYPLDQNSIPWWKWNEITCNNKVV